MSANRPPHLVKEIIWQISVQTTMSPEFDAIAAKTSTTQNALSFCYAFSEYVFSILTTFYYLSMSPEMTLETAPSLLPIYKNLNSLLRPKGQPPEGPHRSGFALSSMAPSKLASRVCEQVASWH